MLVCGIDETGRGPMIGPMVIGCVLLDEEGRKALKRLEVRDSKKVPAHTRTVLEPKIKERAAEWHLIKISASEIDRMRKSISLNALEAMRMSDLICGLANLPAKVIVDSPDPDPLNFRERIRTCLLQRNAHVPEILSEHRADDTYVEVAAASIIAKVERDRDIEALKQEYGEIGSGYPSDEVTQEFVRRLLRTGGELPDFVRRSWSSVDKGKQTRLGEY